LALDSARILAHLCASVPRAMAKIVRRNDGWLQRPTTFEIQVTGEGSSFAVQRRYNDFLELEEQLRHNEFWDVSGLPSMPPRSFVVRRLNPSFLDARQKHLGELLEAALARDPKFSTPALRVFLGLDKNVAYASTDCSTDLGDSSDSLIFHGLEPLMSDTCTDSDLENLDLRLDTHMSDTDLENSAWRMLDRLENEWTDSDLENSADSSATSILECVHPGCMQCFAEKRSFVCHMKFVHGWEDCQLNFSHGWEVL